MLPGFATLALGIFRARSAPRIAPGVRKDPRRGVSRKTVTLWKRQERLSLTRDGKVNVAASEKLLALRPETYRGGTAKAKPGKAGEKSAKTGKRSSISADKAVPILDRSPEEIAESSSWTLVEAQRVKEIYLALLQKQKFEVERGELVEIEAVGREYSMVRERLLTIPGKISASLVGCDRTAIEALLLDEITQALAELHEPGQVDDERKPKAAAAPPRRKKGSRAAAAAQSHRVG